MYKILFVKSKMLKVKKKFFLKSRKKIFLICGESGEDRSRVQREDRNLT